MIRNKIVQALDARYRAELMEAQAQLEVYLENPAGIGEHPQIVEEASKLVKTIVESTEMVKYCQGLYYRDQEENSINTNDLDETVQALVQKMDNFLTALGGSSEEENK
jgi:hypothetical protein